MKEKKNKIYKPILQSIQQKPFKLNEPPEMSQATSYTQTFKLDKRTNLERSMEVEKAKRRYNELAKAFTTGDKRIKIEEEMSQLLNIMPPPSIYIEVYVDGYWEMYAKENIVEELEGCGTAEEIEEFLKEYAEQNKICEPIKCTFTRWRKNNK